MMPVLQIIDLEVEDENKPMSAQLAPHAKMASSIIRIKQAGGRCTPLHLVRMGYAFKEVMQHWGFAHSIASAAIAENIRLQEGENDA